MTIESPATMLVTKKYTGIKGEYHNGCSLEGAIRKRDPKDDWCMVDNITPKIVSTIVNLTTRLRARLKRCRGKFNKENRKV